MVLSSAHSPNLSRSANIDLTVRSSRQSSRSQEYRVRTYASVDFVGHWTHLDPKARVKKLEGGGSVICFARISTTHQRFGCLSFQRTKVSQNSKSLFLFVLPVRERLLWRTPSRTMHVSLRVTTPVFASEIYTQQRILHGTCFACFRSPSLLCRRSWDLVQKMCGKLFAHAVRCVMNNRFTSVTFPTHLAQRSSWPHCKATNFSRMKRVRMKWIHLLKVSHTLHDRCATRTFWSLLVFVWPWKKLGVEGDLSPTWIQEKHLQERTRFQHSHVLPTNGLEIGNGVQWLAWPTDQRYLLQNTRTKRRTSGADLGP